MTSLPVPAYGGLPAGAVATAQRLAGVVHDEGGADDVAELLTTLDRDDLYAVCVTLAAMVDVDKTPAQLLAWFTGEEHKTCCTCRRSLTVESFASDRSRRDGLNARCRECHRVQYQLRQRRRLSVVAS